MDGLDSIQWMNLDTTSIFHKLLTSMANILQVLRRWGNFILFPLEWMFSLETLSSGILYSHYLSNTMIPILLWKIPALCNGIPKIKISLIV
jgi:hypothetical protein